MAMRFISEQEFFSDIQDADVALMLVLSMRRGSEECRWVAAAENIISRRRCFRV